MRSHISETIVISTPLSLSLSLTSHLLNTPYKPYRAAITPNTPATPTIPAPRNGVACAPAPSDVEVDVPAAPALVLVRVMVVVNDPLVEVVVSVRVAVVELVVSLTDRVSVAVGVPFVPVRVVNCSFQIGRAHV